MGWRMMFHSLITVKRDLELRVCFDRDAGVAGSVAVYGPEPVGGVPFFAELAIGPFDTNLDVAVWLMKQFSEVGALKLC